MPKVALAKSQSVRRTPVCHEIMSNNVFVFVYVWACAPAAERSVVYCFLGTVISVLFSGFLKWPERLWVLQRQKVVMAETWSFSSGCLIISQLSPNYSNSMKAHATATNQIIPGLNLHNWSPTFSLFSESAPLSLSIFVIYLSLSTLPFTFSFFFLSPIGKTNHRSLQHCNIVCYVEITLL